MKSPKVCCVRDLQGDEYQAVQDDATETLRALAGEVVPKSAWKKGYDYLIYKSKGSNFPYDVTEMWGVFGTPFLEKTAYRII